MKGSIESRQAVKGLKLHRLFMKRVVGFKTMSVREISGFGTCCPAT